MTALVRPASALAVWVVQPLAVAAILGVGFVAASRLSLRREPPKVAEDATYAPLVRTVTVERGDRAVRLRSHGSLEARTRIDLVPQVGGRVVEIHPGLRSGGSFRADEALLCIEPLDYELAVARAEAEVTTAESEAVTLRVESAVAIEEWELLNPDEPCPPLVALEPQLERAAARVRTAELQLEQARLDLARASVSLPFDGRVVRSTVDVGQVVAAGAPVAVVYATDVFEVAVPLRMEELAWLELPGARAKVSGAGARGPFELNGEVARVEGELDGTSRLARAVVEVRPQGGDSAALPLPGTFVDVELAGSTLVDVASIPAAALREGGVVWLVAEERLSFARPVPRFRGDGEVLVEGIEAGDRVVVSNLEVATDGMQVRVAEGDDR